MQRGENLVYTNNGVNGQKIDTIHMVYKLTVRTGRSTPADLVQSRFTQISPRSVSELESVLTLIFVCATEDLEIILYKYIVQAPGLEGNSTLGHV